MTLPAPTPLDGGGGGGGGGGGITSEADEILLIDEGNSDEPFLRRFVKDDNGVISGTVDTELDGTTAYVATGPVGPATVQPSTLGTDPNVVVTYTRLTNASSTITAGALAVQYVVIADSVTVEGVAVPANVGITHEVPGGTTDSLAFDATGGGTGDVLIIEERAA